MDLGLAPYDNLNSILKKQKLLNVHILQHSFDYYFNS
jgi:hypothetical protein